MSRMVRPRLVARLLQQCRREVGGSSAARTPALKWPLDENTRLSTRMLDVEKHWRETTTGEGMTGPPVKNNKSTYVLSMFPYPSGALHMGHLRVYTISDVIARYYRADGHEVIHPIGWDAFGLPAENAARERGVDPGEWTKSNIESMKDQLLKTGIHFDWDREINTSSPDFYRWTQWIFTQMHRAGLVRRGMNEVNWDPVDNTVLAAEQIDENGCSWRSGAVAEKRRMNTWLIETPKYAKRLLDGLSSLDGRWHEVADIQSNWIGRCDVRRFMMPVRTRDSPFTSSSSLEFLDLRLSDPLSLPSAAFVLLSATDSLVRGDGRNKEQPYISSLEVLNVVTGRFIPIVVVPKEYLDGTSAAYGGLAPEYVLGARLSHEEADAQLAASLGLELKNEKRGGTVANMTLNDVEEIAAFGGYGGYVTSRNLMDWAVSRQRAWGTPIPIILGEDGSSSAIHAEKLPLLSEQRGRKVEGLTSSSYETDTLDTFFDSAWYYLRYLDPRNQKQLVDPSLAARHMPVDVYVGGVEHAALHLYYARFFSYFLADIGAVKYEGTLEPFKHLVPQGIVKGLTYVDETTGRYVKESDVDLSGTKPRVRVDCTTEGVTAGKELSVKYEKMSKSKHNGVDPVKVLEQDGIDLARLQLLDTSSPRAPINWGESDSSGIKRWLDRMSWVVNAYVEGRKGAERGYAAKTAAVERKEEELREAYNYFVRNVGMTLEVLHLLNTSIARLQGLTNALRKMDKEVLAHSVQAERCIYALITMLQVFAPHTAAELYAAVQQVQPIEMKTAARVSEQPWPEVDADAIIDLTLHVNGVNCGRAPVQRPLVEDLSLEELITRASTHEHKSMIDWLREKQGVIKKATTEGRKGSFITLSLEALDANGEKVSEEKIKKQLDEMAKVRIRLAREEKKKEKKKKAQ
uniref:leucine--tRNA ligase n=1 Tax=Pristionchus pacificus TaxID=54126 RepID=A0A8R1V340_PRIPA